ncbi:FtsW/RodA/SpoVE family cell cycle protein [Corynebacterium epidermidicanis]|uniref:Probable peptidoglycan glycosyltransferase FtsW n=1 Tax=Corynebacterium epidermidicanis TaxID=1050174 RepID=A0A0G3GXC7_9CORY|nr:putative peptidoglycan glycosyltransferase FtsW [Corynebacterium epidermidicanis]AKK03522.1 cell division-specific peptidoglycan biosynthesis regulator FtsW [Corynebacterium epidermidicanis]
MSEPSRPNRNAPASGAAQATRPAPAKAPAHLWQRAVTLWDDLHLRPLIDYYFIMIFIVFLAALGVVMVFSSSMTWSVVDTSSVWSTAVRQAIMVGIGLFLMWVAMRIRPVTLRVFAPWILVVAILLLVAVLIPGIGTGKEEVGSQSWISLGVFSFQPSEIAKVAIAIWGANYLGQRAEEPGMGKFYVFGGVSGLMVLLIALQGDAGMAVTFMLMVAAVAFFAGIHLNYVLGALAFCGAGLVWLAMSGGFRGNRFTVYFDALFGHFEDTRGTAFQSYQGFLSLADGAVSGVGLGQSRAKWFYLPEAKNDFIFAIVGEELGFIGGIFVICAFGGLAFYGLRCALKSQNTFMSLLAASLTTGVVVQAFINIGYVVGLFPVTGIQLPMISAGGTSAVITLASMGLLLSCARYEPEAISAMQSYGKPALDHLLGLREPDASDIDSRRPMPRRAHKAPEPVPVTRQRPHTAASPRSGEAPGQRVQRPPAQRSVADGGRRPVRGTEADPRLRRQQPTQPRRPRKDY